MGQYDSTLSFERPTRNRRASASAYANFSCRWAWRNEPNWFARLEDQLPRSTWNLLVDLVTRFADRDDFAATIDAAAERLGISSTAVEKDYWVSEILRILAREFCGSFVFKGGTSLSKGYHLVERFSEDVDILILPGIRGRTATDKLMKTMAAVVAETIGGSALGVGGSETGRHRSFEIAYRTSRERTALINTSVLLEMGTRGGSDPHEFVSISSLIGGVLQTAGTDITKFEDLAPFNVAVLHPARTLLEKLAHISSLSLTLSIDPSQKLDLRSGRHFYDVYQLLGDARVLEFLEDREQTEGVLSSIVETDRIFFSKENVERPSPKFTVEPIFNIETTTSQKLRSAYESTMRELFFGAGPLPTWEQICNRVVANEHLLQAFR
jgi:hypothetical protein